MFKRVISKYDYLTGSILFVRNAKFVFLLLGPRSFTFGFIKTSEEFEALISLVEAEI